MEESFIQFAIVGFAIIVAYSGFTIIRAFAGSIKNMQKDTETTWARDSAAEEARITNEKNMAAGGLI